MKKVAVFLAIFALASVIAMGFSVEIGGGVNLFSVFGISIPLPTASVGVGIPIVNAFSLTGQFNVLFPISSSSEGNSMAYMFLGGGRFTFNMKKMNVFVGADGGVLTDFQSTGGNIPIFGVNGGVNFSIFYFKAAMRWMMVTSSETVSHPTTVFLPLNEFTAGLAFSF